MLINRTEKEQRVIDLYQQGKTIREIAQYIHMSFGDIGAIIQWRAPIIQFGSPTFLQGTVSVIDPKQDKVLANVTGVGIHPFAVHRRNTS